MWIKKYIALLRAGILDQLQYRVATLVIFFGNLVYLTIVYFLWKAIFASSETGIVGGMTFESTLVYLVLATGLFNSMTMYAVWEIGRNVQSGKIVLELIRPFEYRRYLLWSFIGPTFVSMLTTFLPTFIVVELITGCAVPVGLNLIYFAVSVAFSILINYYIDFIVGTICIYTESIWGVNIMKEVIVLLFSGVTIPLAFFPEKLMNVAMCLPFRTIYDSPLRILMTENPDFMEMIKILMGQALWFVALSMAAKLFWDTSIKRITVNGG